MHPRETELDADHTGGVPTVPVGSTPIVRVKNRGFASNTYFVPTAAPGECVVIDPGLDGDAIVAEIHARGLTPRAIVCTHGHFDHLGSAARLQRELGIDLYLHPADERVAKSAGFIMMACKVPGRIEVPRFDHALADGCVVTVGGTEVRFLHAPGHTAGSGIVIVGDAAFTGDTIYRNAIGLVSLPGEDRAQLRASILAVWDVIGDERVVYPGHGGAAYFGAIKRGNAPLREFLGIDSPQRVGEAVDG